MGCFTSKQDNEFMVRRCKERRRLLEDAVWARYRLAVAHFDYCLSLRITGSALFTFAQNEPFSVPDQTPAMFLRSTSPVPPRIPSLQPPPPPPPPLPPLSHSCTPSQTTSVWNWENFYPPSPPDSEFFHQRAQNNNLDDDDIDEEEGNREDAESRSEIRTRLNFGSLVHAESVVNEPRLEGSSESEKWEDARSSRSHRTSEIEEMKEELRHKDLKEIVEAIREHFDMAAAAGEQVSEMLEIGKEQLDHSFRQSKKTVNYSGSMLSRSSSSWTSVPLLAVKYQLDASSLDESGCPKSLCSTLERLRAWEKKLYAEVKAKEGLKIEREKKLLKLQSQENKGEDEAKLDQNRASLKRLQSQIIVSSQAVSTTSTTILNLGDTDLIPQLVDMCHGFMCMWRSMHQNHEVQSNIVQQVRGLVNWSVKSDSTSELHRQATYDLESAVSAWHSSFCRLIKFQQDFIRSIQRWFRLIHLPVDDDNIGGSSEPSRVYAFLDEWKLALDRVPHTAASEAIRSFVNVVHMISVRQNEDYKIKKRTETASKELKKKASSLRNIERKFSHSYSMVGLGPPDSGHDNRHTLYARDQLAKMKSEFAASQRRVEEEMLSLSQAVEETRAMTLNNLQMGLPGVFFALTIFSAFLADALESVCTSSNAIN